MKIILDFHLKLMKKIFWTSFNIYLHWNWNWNWDWNGQKNLKTSRNNTIFPTPEEIKVCNLNTLGHNEYKNKRVGIRLVAAPVAPQQGSGDEDKCDST